VFGILDEVFGEAVKAVFQLIDISSADDALEAQLISWCRGHLSVIKALQIYRLPRNLAPHPDQLTDKTAFE